MRVLIGYDGANAPSRLIAELKRAGFPVKGEMLIIVVIEGIKRPAPSKAFLRGSDSSYRAYNARMFKEQGRADKMAEDAAREIQTAFPSWKVKTRTCIGSPASEIIKKADAWKADLIVVGSHNPSNLTSFFFGSVAQSVVTNAACSVRLVRGMRKADSPIRVIIGVDGSRDSRRAIDAVAKRAWPKGTGVYLITAMDSQMSSAAFVPGWGIGSRIEKKDKRERQWIRRMSSSFEGKLKDKGLKTSIIIGYGNPKQVLVEEAEHLRADCVFLGARGLRSFKRLFMGSVSAAVAARAVGSVEAVRPKGRAFLSD